MPRPDITAERLAQMEEDFQEYIRNPPPDMRFIKHVAPEALDNIRQIMYAGWWLEDQLVAVRCPPQRVRDLCFALGQHCFGRDPWDMAKYVLDGYRSGNPETPGPELAERIFNERVRMEE